MFGLEQGAQQEQMMMMCRQGLNPVGPRCAPTAAAAGRVMPWERPRPRPEGQFNNCEILREGSTAPPSRLNIGQVGACLEAISCHATIRTPLFGVLLIMFA